MKAKATPALFFGVAFGALFVPVSFELAMSMGFLAALTAILLTDYGHEHRPVDLPKPPADSAPHRHDHFGLAV